MPWPGPRHHRSRIKQAPATATPTFSFHPSCQPFNICLLCVVIAQASERAVASAATRLSARSTSACCCCRRRLLNKPMRHHVVPQASALTAAWVATPSLTRCTSGRAGRRCPGACPPLTRTSCRQEYSNLFEKLLCRLVFCREACPRLTRTSCR